MTERGAVDHSLLSPSGRMSKRARAKALGREMHRLFGGENLVTSADLLKARLAAIQPTKAEALRRQAAELRALAERGMKPRKYAKEALRLEAEAAALERPKEGQSE